MFNRGASFATLTQDGKIIGQVGTIVAKQAVAVDIANNIYRLRAFKNGLKTSGKMILSLQLLTDLEEIQFSSLDDLLEQIIPNVDGLLLRSGEREGYLLPQAWQNAKDKKQFITNLKMNAGLSPTYWSDDIRIFKFRTVEVK